MPKKAELIFFGLLLLTAGSMAFADDADRQKVADEMTKYRFKNVTTPEGLNFNIPEDMPIETRNGIKAPIPYDEYLYFRFKKLEEKLIETDAKIDKLADTLKDIQRSLAASEKKNSPSGPSGP